MTGHVINAAVPQAAIEVDALEKFFSPARSGWRAFLQPFEKPTLAALAGVSLEVREGEAVGLLGANGAGKSTLLRILATLLFPTRGAARIAGCDTMREPRAVRRQLGYHSGSDLGFFPRLTGRENLLFFGQLNHLSLKVALARITGISSQLRLEEALNRQVRTLSSGTVQRLSLARALLHLPRILLLDEPTRSLDAVAAAEFRHLLKDQVLKRGSTSLLFASHSLSELEVLADRIAILDQGRLLALDSPSALVRNSFSASLEETFFKITGHAPTALKEPQE